MKMLRKKPTDAAKEWGSCEEEPVSLTEGQPSQHGATRRRSGPYAESKQIKCHCASVVVRTEDPFWRALVDFGLYDLLRKRTEYHEPKHALDVRARVAGEKGWIFVVEDAVHKQRETPLGDHLRASAGRAN